MSETELLQSTVSEYRELLSFVKTENPKVVGTDRLTQTLSGSGDWTEAAAQSIVSLANQYGAFMLRNALALAIALDKEDGDMGF